MTKDEAIFDTRISKIMICFEKKMKWVLCDTNPSAGVRELAPSSGENIDARTQPRPFSSSPFPIMMQWLFSFKPTCCPSSRRLPSLSLWCLTDPRTPLIPFLLNGINISLKKSLLSIPLRCFRPDLLSFEPTVEGISAADVARPHGRLVLPSKWPSTLI